MRSLSVGEFKASFSEVIKSVLAGQEVGGVYGKKKQKLGVMVPYSAYKKRAKRKLGLLAGKATFVIKAGFKMSDEELLTA